MKKLITSIFLILFSISAVFADISIVADGAAQGVGGSAFLIENGSKSAIVDMGMFMDGEEEDDSGMDKRNFEIPQNFIDADALVLTHAHSDHIGRVPLLIALGFSGKIYSTKATKDLAYDFFGNGTGFEFIKRKWFWDKESLKKTKTAHWISDCRGKIKSLAESSKPLRIDELAKEAQSSFVICAICRRKEAQNIISRFIAVEYDKDMFISKSFSFRLIDAAHIPGSASIVFDIDGSRIVFSGDLGSGFSRLNGENNPAPKADAVFVEATNGAGGAIFNLKGFEVFHNDLTAQLSKGKIIWIPALSFNRTQKILYELKIMQDDKILDENIPIYSVSPSANRIISLYEREIKKEKSDWFAKEIYEKQTILPKNLSRKMPKFDKKMIILSSSGDMERGMSRRLYKDLGARDDVFMMIVNYVSPDSLAGKLLAGGADNIKRYGIFSDHPDPDGILRWLSNQDKDANIYLMHGGRNELLQLKSILEKNGWKNVHIVKVKEKISHKRTGRNEK
jgi:metallo-beta-lactamase family protein